MNLVKALSATILKRGHKITQDNLILIEKDGQVVVYYWNEAVLGPYPQQAELDANEPEYDDLIKARELDDELQDKKVFKALCIYILRWRLNRNPTNTDIDAFKTEMKQILRNI